jgi:receptor protein-tyrosine kinase
MSSIEKAMQRKRSGAAQEVPLHPDTDREAEARQARAPHAFDRIQRSPDVTLDRQILTREGLLTPEDEESVLREQYRMVKRRLIATAFAQDHPGTNPPNLIEVTSSLDGEGKTFTTFNLAMSIAMERDVTVLMVDADLAHQSLTRITGLSGKKGLTEFLTGEVSDLAEVVFRTDVPRMAVIPAGAHHPSAPELIASESMRRCTKELAGRYGDRVILFDTTPLLMNSQAATLAGHMGQILVVVEAGRTNETAVRDAVGMFSEADVSRNLLLNKSAQARNYGYYGYGGY